MPTLEHVTREHAEAWLVRMRERGNKPATLRNRYTGLQQLFRWMMENDRL